MLNARLHQYYIWLHCLSLAILSFWIQIIQFNWSSFDTWTQSNYSSLVTGHKVVDEFWLILNKENLKIKKAEMALVYNFTYMIITEQTKRCPFAILVNLLRKLEIVHHICWPSLLVFSFAKLTDFDELISLADGIFRPLKVAGPHLGVGWSLLGQNICRFWLNLFIFSIFLRNWKYMSRLRENAAA